MNVKMTMALVGLLLLFFVFVVISGRCCCCCFCFCCLTDNIFIISVNRVPVGQTAELACEVRLNTKYDNPFLFYVCGSFSWQG